MPPREYAQVMKDRERAHVFGFFSNVKDAMEAAAAVTAALEVNHSEEVIVPAARSVLSKAGNGPL